MFQNRNLKPKAAMKLKVFPKPEPKGCFEVEIEGVS